MRRLLPVAALAFLALPAAAHGNDGQRGRDRPLLDAIQVEALSATAVQGAVEIRYRMRAEDLARWRHYGVEPALRVDLGRRAEVIRLSSQDVMRLRPEGRPPSHVEVSLIDLHPGPAHVDLNLDLGAATVSSLRLPVKVRVPPGPPPVAWSDHADVVAACRAALPFSARGACERAVDHAAFRPVELIHACDRAFLGQEDTLACIERGALASRNPRVDVEACDQAFVSGATTVQCVAQAAASPYPMEDVIARCDALFVGEAKAQQCVAEARGHHPVVVLRALERCEGRISDQDQLRCIERRLQDRVARRDP